MRKRCQQRRRVGQLVADRHIRVLTAIEVLAVHVTVVVIVYAVCARFIATLAGHRESRAIGVSAINILIPVVVETIGASKESIFGLRCCRSADRYIWIFKAAPVCAVDISVSIIIDTVRAGGIRTSSPVVNAPQCSADAQSGSNSRQVGLDRYPPRPNTE